ncbi:PREDICTED: probable LRR receptor-like serine/threonine-protein kinase At3g47570-like [Fragaria vesca subsp. vesca]
MDNFRYLHVLALLLFTNLLQPTAVVSSFVNETDHLALLKFKESIVADPHGFLNSWNDSVHFCKWGGVTCGRRHQRVTGLNLSDADLNGTISPYIGNLSFLRFISLPRNKFAGLIPQQVGQLFRLRRLHLDTNMLEGGIPVNLTFCPELSVISIRENRLKGDIPSEIGSLTKLVFLNLGRNNLTGRVPPNLGNLSSLETLGLGENNLVGTVPEEMGQLRNLRFFSIHFCILSGMLPPSLFNMSSMQVFSFTGNKFKGIVPLPPSIDLNMPHLHTMFLGGNEFSGQIPASFANASKLRALDISKNNYVGQVPTSFGVLPNLQLLNLGRNNLGSNSSNDLEYITFLTNCSNLELLSLAVNNFGGVLPNSVANFSTQLTQLYLGGNQIVGTIPETLGNLNSLIFLGLENNLFTGIIPSSFGKLQNLQILSLSTNRLSGWIPSSLGNLTHLFRLQLYANELEGIIPPDIGNCQSLQIINLSHNNLSGDIPSQVIGMSSLSGLLNLSQNSLTGSLPVEVGKLKNIRILDISGNNLTGEIPETVEECQSLEFLHLQDNLFQGRIPSSLTSLKGLQYVDLSKNNLSSQIPKNLQRLPFLIYLNLSFNNLEGEVPKEGVFRNISAISLNGNTKLCGGDLALRLPACPINVLKKKKFNGLKLYFTISLVVGCSLLFAIISALYWRKKTQKSTKQLSALPSINFLSRVSYQRLHQATGGFSLSNQIGSGSVGSVYKGILDEQENSVVAIKVLNLEQKGAFKSFVAECNALRNIRHKNLVKILTCCSSTDHDGNDFKALVFEYKSNGSLEEWLHSENQSRSLNLLQRLNIAVDVASALCYLHDHCEPQIIHRDMKPSNVLLDEDMVACVGRRPTDQIFVDGDNIHTFVKTAIQGRIMQIVDPALIATREEETATSTTNNEGTKIDDHNNEIIVDEENVDSESLSKMNTYLWKCILPTLKIGVACSEESPRNRMSMEEVLRELHRIKNAYNAIPSREAKKKLNIRNSKVSLV